MKLIEAIKRVRLYKSNPNWKMNDYFIEVKNIISNQSSPIKDNIVYTCLRDFQGFCLYVPSSNIDELIYENKDLYNKDYNLLNMSELRRHKIRKNVIGQVYNLSTPITVKIKVIEYILINNINMYLVYTYHLDHNDELFIDLLNYKSIEGKY